MQCFSEGAIFIVSADAKAAHSVRTPEGFGTSQLAWSGDGSHVAYLRADSVIGGATTDATMSRAILQNVKTGVPIVGQFMQQRSKRKAGRQTSRNAAAKAEKRRPDGALLNDLKWYLRARRCTTA